MSIDAMKQALEALEELHRTGDTQVFDLCFAPKVIPALRLAIEQAEKQEPVAWMLGGEVYRVKQSSLFSIPPGKEKPNQTPLYTAPPQQEKQEPVAWVGLEQSDMPDGDDPMYDHDFFIKGMVWADVTLRKKNAAPPQRQPLNWKPLQEFWRNNSSLDWDELEAAVKAAHGIGGGE